MKIIFALIAVITSTTSLAVQVGSMKSSFGNGDWVVNIASSDLHYLDSAIMPGNITYSLGYIESATDTYQYFITSHLSDGTLNTGVVGGLEFKIIQGAVSFVEVPPSGQIDYVYKESNDQKSIVAAVGLGNSVKVLHLDVFGDTYNTYNLNFSDMINNFNGPVTVQDVKHYTSPNNFPRVLITTEVFLNNLGDSDFGLTSLDVGINNNFLLTPGFGDFSRTMCAHDHSDYPNFEFSPDTPTSVAYGAASQTFILAGTAHEYAGRNQAFCQFDINGALIAKWSSQSQFLFEDHQERVNAILLDESTSTPLLYVAGANSGANDLDFALSRYTKNGINQWVIDSSFGTNGYTTVGFNSLSNNVGSDDIATHLLLQKNGNMLVGGNSSWSENNFDFSHIRLMEIDSEGQHLSQWGTVNGQVSPYWGVVQQLGYINENLAGLALNSYEDILISGTASASNNGTDQKVGVVTLLINDPIFSSSFNAPD